MKRRFGREMVNNCWLFVVTLILRGKLRGIVLFWDSALPHAAGITKHGNMIHFRRTRGKPKTCSIWLTGVAEVAPVAYIKQSEVKTTKWEWK